MVAMVREVCCMVRERCARRSLAAMVVVVGDLSEGVCWNCMYVVLQKWK